MEESYVGHVLSFLSPHHPKTCPFPFTASGCENLIQLHSYLFYFGSGPEPYLCRWPGVRFLPTQRNQTRGRAL